MTNKRSTVWAVGLCCLIIALALLLQMGTAPAQQKPKEPVIKVDRHTTLEAALQRDAGTEGRFPTKNARRMPEVGEQRMGGRVPTGSHRFVGTKPPSMVNYLERDYLYERWSKMRGGYGTLQGGNEPEIINLTTPDLDVPDPEATSDEIDPKWARDNLRVVFASNAEEVRQALLKDKKTEVNYLAGDRGPMYHIWQMDPDGRYFTLLTDGDEDERYPEISPGGNRLIYSKRPDPSGNYNLFVLDLITHEVRQVTFGGADCIQASWTNLGDEVVFARSVGGGTYKIYAVQVDGSNLRPLTSVDDPQAGNDTEPVVAPDGQRIAFIRDGRIWMMDIIGQNQTQWTNFEGSVERDPAWQPARGRAHPEQLLFASTRFDSDGDDRADSIGGRYDVYSILTTRPEGYSEDQNWAEARVTDEMAEDVNPSGRVRDHWSPDGAVWLETVIWASDRGTDDGLDHGIDLFMSIPTTDVEDVRPPSLETLPTVTPRYQLPGEDVVIRARPTDDLSGVDRLWVQFKDPDDQWQDAEGIEHKLYLYTFAEIETGMGVFVYLEAGCEAIDPVDYTYDWPFVLDYWMFGFNPSQPPPHSLELYDDGPVETGGHEAEGEIAEDGIYTNTWTTPTAPSDFYVDVILRDTVGNWMVYDSVYGFTTQAFVPTQTILYVQDYGHGQWFPSPHDAGIRYQYVPTESWLTWNPTMFIDPNNPNIGDAWWYDPDDMEAQGPAVSQSPLGYDGYSRDGSMAGGQPYDIWRTQCRGKVTKVALGSYLPYVIEEPNPTKATTTRTRKASERMVFWSSPYSGDLWVADGTILDPFVQENVQWFVSNGGRMFLSGQNIGWALTLDGTVSSSLLTSTFGVTYDFDFNGGWADYHMDGSTVETDLRPVQHPIVNSMFAGYQVGMEHFVREWPWWPFLSSAVQNPTPIALGGYAVAPGFMIAVEDIHATRMDACPNQGFVDNFDPTGKGQREYDTTAGYLGMALTHDTASHAKTAYAGFGLEGLFNSVHQFTPPLPFQPQLPHAVSDRYRMQVLHNVACWMRQGRLSGVLTYFDHETKEYKPLANALVSVWSGGLPIGSPEGTALTNAQGAFLVAGLDSYDHGVTAYRPGFLMQHGILVGVVEGPLETTGFDIILTKTQPGWISGEVRDQNGEPVMGVTVTATETIFGVLSYSAVTDNTGEYRLDAVETGNYIVRITDYPEGYGASVPPSYGDLTDDTSAPPKPLIVLPNSGVTGIDFVLEGSPGTITGMVTSETTGQVISNAQIEVLAGGTVRHTGNTGENGRYTIAEVPAGMYSVRCTAPGYVVMTMSSIQVLSGETTTVDFELEPMPPGALSGQVRYFTDNSFAGAGVATISVYLGTTLVAGPAATTDPITSSDGYTYNFKFDEVPAGTYTVVMESDLYNSDPPSQSGVKVTSGLERKNVNFKLVPLHIFANGLRLISSLYDYDNLLHGVDSLDAADLLNITRVDNGITYKPLDMAMWYAGSYLYYPKGPSDPRPPNPSELARTFRLGRGYFLSLESNAPLTRKGVEAPINSPYPIECDAGWNLIGAVFSDEVNWAQVQVQVGSNTPITMFEAINAGYITNQIWTYLGLGSQYENSTVLRPWEGYWTKTDRALKLLVPPPLGRGRGSDEGGRSRGLVSGNDEDGWLLQLVASSGATRDSSNYIGMHTDADDGFDNVNDLEEPPAVAGVPYLALYFPHDGWGARSGRYAMDVRSSSGTTAVWEPDVETNLSTSEVSLSWPRISRVPADVSLTLVDTKTGARTFMRTASSYRFRLEDGEHKRRFRIEMARDDEGLLRITDVLAKPARAAQGSAISFAITREANVDVRITSLNGRAVRRISGGETRARGVNQVVWDGRDDAGRSVPAGVYIVELRAASADGQKVRAVQMLNVVK